MGYRVDYSCVSHIGNVRSINQDNFFCDGKYFCMDNAALAFPLNGSLSCYQPFMIGVFDGMGGEERGEIASLIAAKCAAETSIRAKALDDLKVYCKNANEQICAYAAENGICAMGTTAAILAFTQKKITLCNIGDSKIFRFANQKLEQISVDHYAVAPNGKKPPLSQNLGIPTSEMLIDPYFAKGAYHDGDVYLISSDGLTDMVSAEEITQILCRTAFDATAEKLLATALENGGKDNITVILCRITQEKTSLFNSFFQSKKRRGENGNGN